MKLVTIHDKPKKYDKPKEYELRIANCYEIMG